MYVYVYIYIYIYVCVCVCVTATNVNWKFAWRLYIYQTDMCLFDIWLLQYPVIWNNRCCTVVAFTRSKVLGTMMSCMKHICCGLIKCILNSNWGLRTQNFPDKYHISICIATFNYISISLYAYIHAILPPLDLIKEYKLNILLILYVILRLFMYNIYHKLGSRQLE